MARRKQTAGGAPGPVTEAELGYVRFKAAQWAFVMTGDLPANWIDDPWWSRWQEKSNQLWGARDWTPLGDHYQKALKRKGADALKAYEVHLRRYELQLERNPRHFARMVATRGDNPR